MLSLKTSAAAFSRDDSDDETRFVLISCHFVTLKTFFVCANNNNQANIHKCLINPSTPNRLPRGSGRNCYRDFLIHENLLREKILLKCKSRRQRKKNHFQSPLTLVKSKFFDSIHSFHPFLCRVFLFLCDYTLFLRKRCAWTLWGRNTER